jgi:hypothetical protein
MWWVRHVDRGTTKRMQPWAGTEFWWYCSRSLLSNDHSTFDCISNTHRKNDKPLQMQQCPQKHKMTSSVIRKSYNFTDLRHPSNTLQNFWQVILKYFSAQGPHNCLLGSLFSMVERTIIYVGWNWECLSQVDELFPSTNLHSYREKCETPCSTTF